MRILRAVGERVLPFLFILFLMLAFDAVWVTVLMLTVAAIHEGGHIIAAMVIGVGDMSMPRAVLTGLRLKPGRLLSYREEAVVALGGPLINLVLFVVLLPFCRYGEYVASFAVINLLTAVSNLIPIRSFDGHRILIGLLSGRLSQDGLDRVSRGLTLCISAAVALLSLFFMMKIGEGYWIFVVFFVIMCREIMAAHKSAKNENSRVFERI